MEQLRVAAGIELLHVPYKGAAPAVVDLLSGRIDAALGSIIRILGLRME